VLGLGVHLLLDAVDLCVLQPHPLNNLEVGPVLRQVLSGEVPAPGHVVHLNVGHVVLEAQYAGPANWISR